MGGPPPFVVCPRCRAVFLAGPTACPSCLALLPTPRAPTSPPFLKALVETMRVQRAWRRTRAGLLWSALALMLLWVPWASLGAFLALSVGSTVLFLGARGLGGLHRIAVTVAFVAFLVGGIAIAALFGAFLYDAYVAAYLLRPMATIADTASLVVWGTLPATIAVAAGIALQVTYLLPASRRVLPWALVAVLIATAVIATLLAAGELAAFGAAPVRRDTVIDFLWRFSLYRIVEAPPYVGLGVMYLIARSSATVPPTPAKA